MERKTVLGGLSLLFFISIFFTSTDSNLWIYFLILGIIFGIGWFKS